jgi:hypothetical protein
MKTILELERLGYTFSTDGDSIHYVHRGKRPDPERVRPLLEHLKHHREDAVRFVRKQALAAKADALLARWDGTPEWRQAWAETEARLAGTTQNESHYPLTLHFPSDAKVAVIEGQWQRLPNGVIEATYNTQQELAWSLLAVGIDTPEIREALD